MIPCNCCVESKELHINNALQQHLNAGRDLGYDTFPHVLKSLLCNEEELRSLFERRQAVS